MAAQEEEAARDGVSAQDVATTFGTKRAAARAVEMKPVGESPATIGIGDGARDAYPDAHLESRRPKGTGGSVRDATATPDGQERGANAVETKRAGALPAMLRVDGGAHAVCPGGPCGI